jgi:hypothetical protein
MKNADDQDAILQCNLHALVVIDVEIYVLVNRIK